MSSKAKAQPWSGLIDGADRVVREVLCVECGASLRGQLVSERCVGCGHPVSDSVHGDYLVDSDRDMVRRLAESARFVMFGAIALASVIGVGLTVRLIAARNLTAAIAGMFDMLLAGGMISPMVSALGLVILNPGRTINYYLARYSRPQSLLQLVLVLAVMVAICVLGMMYISDVFGSIVRICWIFIPLGMFLVSIEKLMRRVPNIRLARLSRAHFILTIVLAVVSLVGLLIRIQLPRLPKWEDFLLGVMFFASLSAIGCTISGLRLLINAQRALITAAR